MSDIMSFIRNREAVHSDPDGYMLDLDDWSEAIAENLAAAEGIQLTENHLEVIRFLRDDYRRNGPREHARDITNLLEDAFLEQGGSQYLFRLFPNGPVRQACRIAGLPVPGDSSNPSFGNVF